MKLTTAGTWGAWSAFSAVATTFTGARTAITRTWAAWGTMATKALIKFFKAHVTAVVCIETGEDGSDTLFGSALEGWEGGKFLKGKNTVLTGDFSKLFGALGGDSFTDGFAGGLTLFAGDFAVAIRVDFSASLFAGCFTCFFDGLTLFFVNDAVFVGVILLEELGESSVAEGLFVVLGHGNASKECAGDQDVG